MATRTNLARRVSRHTAGLVVGCALAALLHAATPQPILDELDEVLITAKTSWPIEDYLEFPRFDSVVISPDGTHVATGWGDDNFQRRLSIIDYPSMMPRTNGPLQVYFGIENLSWMDKNRLLIQPTWPLAGLRRVREHLGTLLVVDIEGHILHELNPIPASLNALDDLRLVQDIVKHPVFNEPVLERGPKAFGPLKAVTTRSASEQLLIQTLWTDGTAQKKGYGVFRLDLRTGKQARVARLPLERGEVIAGPDHRPALVTGVNEAGEHVVYFLPEAARAEGDQWQLLVRGASNRRGLQPVAWTGEGEKYFALDGRNTPTRAVVEWNASNNTQRVLYQRLDADMDEAWLDPAGKPWMFSGSKGVAVYWYPDPAHALAQLHQALVRKLPADHVDIMNATDDLATAVVRISSGQRPTIFLVVDVKTMKSVTGMNTFPKLRGRRLSQVEPIEFPARDGLMIRGYLTTPLEGDGKPRKDLPLLVISHSGPRGEAVDYRYDFERQLFASQGYAILQVNARGSVGRGAAFEAAGEGKWGHEVQDDFADGVRWAIKRGVARAGHVCFYGTGHGAYSAMMAASREPDLFRCVIGVGGVYDLPGLLSGVHDKDADIKMRSSLYRAAESALTTAKGLRDQAATGNLGENEKARALERAESLQWSALYRMDAYDVLAVQTGINTFFPRVDGIPVAEKRRMIETRNSRVARMSGDKTAGIPRYLQRAISNDLEELKARSPFNHASTIKAKVLLIHQHVDQQVSLAQLAVMRKELQTAGNRPGTDTIGDEAGGRWEGYFTLETRADVYKKMLRFLNQQIRD